MDKLVDHDDLVRGMVISYRFRGYDEWVGPCKLSDMGRDMDGAYMLVVMPDNQGLLVIVHLSDDLEIRDLLHH